MPNPDFCELAFYRDIKNLEMWRGRVAAADAVIVGSYVPEGVAVGHWAQNTANGVVAFYDIDTPVTLGKLARGEEEYLSLSLIQGYHVYLSFAGGPMLDRLMRDYGSPAARALYCSVDTNVYRPVATPRRWDLSYLGTYSPDRQPALERLLLTPARRAPELRFAVAGPQYPAEIKWPANVDRLEHVAPAAHPEFYSASRYTLNVTRADMVRSGYSPSVRLFEAAACGSPLISDRWAGIEMFFDAVTEIALADTAEDVLAVLHDSGDARRVAMAESARRRILAGHSAAHRAAELEAHLLEAQRNVQLRRTASPQPATEQFGTLHEGR
jgi:spore maturation protein CgeB